jgi:hypothetical protein
VPMIVGMGDTVLAGPIEFSPAEIAAIVAVLAALFVVVTAPGWGALAYACVRRRRARGAGAVWPAAVGGSLGGLAVSFGVSSLAVAALPAADVVIPVLLAWCACWAVSAALICTEPRRGPGGGGEPTRTTEGWGR